MKSKKILFVISVMIISFIFSISVHADYKCSYDFKVNHTGLFESSSKNHEIKVNTEKKQFDLFGLDLHVIDDEADETYTDEYLITEFLEEKYCPTQVYVCSGHAQRAVRYLAVINTSLITKFPDCDVRAFEGAGMKRAENFCFKVEDCDVGNLNEEKSTGEPKEMEFKCDYFNQLYDGDENNIGLTDLMCYSKKGNCSSSEITKYNEIRNNLIYYCKSLTSFADYVNPCLQECLGIEEKLALIETNTEEYNCGFSDRLMNWIDNILKWIKYILPVIVIVFGIVDFIKAFASDKDDEMKKSQKKFIIRLISAALAFIIPFIIEFILEKMGFVSESCGLW